jgi:hypothetical protein
MHRALVVFGLLLCSGCPAPSARLELSKTALDFGTVEVNGGAYRLPLALTNPGEKTIKVGELRLETTSGELELEANVAELGAGERRVVVVIYKPLTEGSVTGELRLNADDGGGLRTLPVSGRAAVRNATLTASAGASCAGQPGSIDFGTVTNGMPASHTVTIASTGTTSITLLKATTPGASFTVSGAFGTPIEPGQSADFTIAFDPREPNAQSGTVEFLTTSVLHPRLSVAICGVGQVSKLCVTPDELNLGAVDAGTTVTRALTATSCGNLPVTLQSVTFTADPNTPAGLSLGVLPALPAVLDPAATATIPVRVTASSPLATRGTVELLTSSPISPKIDVAVGANLPPPCDLQFTPSTVSFYFLSPRQSVRLTNRGNTDCVLQRIGIAPASAPFALERNLPFPLTVPKKGTLDVGMIFTPSTNGQVATANLEVEVDFVHTAKLVGVSSSPLGCHLVASTSKLDFGLISPGTRPSATFGLQNVGTGECQLSSLTTDRPEFVISTASNAIASNTTLPVTVDFQPPMPPGPVAGNLTVISNDRDTPQLDVALNAGHYLCDPDCHCGDDQVLTYWRYSAGYGGSSIQVLGPNGTFARSCDLATCQPGQVQLEIARGELTCVQKPPECPAGQSLDFVGDAWTCISCEVLVQFGYLFDGQRVCTSKPALTCGANMVPTFDAYSHQWDCRTTCNNTLYDQATFPDGTRACIPC